MRALLLFLATVGSAAGQRDIFDLATTGDGGAVYFASALARRESGEAAPPGAPARIYRIGPEGFQLYLERPRIDPPPATPPGPTRFTNYFNLSRPQTSRDGNVVAVVGQRQCFGSSACGSATTLQTTVTGLPGGTVDVTGAGHLSGNGRYLLIFADGSPGGNCAYVVDLQAGQQARPEGCTSGGFYALGGGRNIADDGTAVSAAGSLYLIRGPAVTQVQTGMGSPGEAVIDSAARMVVYSMFDWGTGRRSIRIYRIGEQRDSALAALGGADSHTPYLSADGRRVMFLSDASGLPQIFMIGTDGGEPRQVSHDSAGVLSAAMSDDGKVAWYFSGAARLYRINLDTGEAQERLGRTPQIGIYTRMTAGSLYSIRGAGISDRVYAAESYPLPRSLGGVSVSVNGVDSPLVSVSPTEILLQVPFQTGLETNVEVKTESSSPFIPQLRFATSTFTGLGAFLLNPRSPSGYGGSDALAVHEDWSALVTSVTPARPGEILHLYGTGFGRVDSQPPDGMPAPADPPARTITPITCWAWGADNFTKMDIPVLFAGLAPGLAGVYQLDVRVPAANLRPSVQLNCIGEGDNSNFYGSFEVKP
ncbi:MAG: hypothetical protein Q8N47_19485 [Bryobacterales bacterium]|nr:hypothetical protein [Bryobacterales bacterium]